MSESRQIVSDTEKELLLLGIQCYIKEENRELTDLDTDQLTEVVETLETELEDQERWYDGFPDFANDFRSDIKLQTHEKRSCQNLTSPQERPFRNVVGISFRNLFRTLTHGMAYKVGEYAVELAFEKLVEIYKAKNASPNAQDVNKVLAQIENDNLNRPKTGGISIATTADNVVKDHFTKNL